MTRKYDVRFCKCGRIHFLENNAIHDAIEKEKEVLFICAHCGVAIRIGADDYFDDGKAMYSIALSNCEKTTIIDERNFVDNETKDANEPKEFIPKFTKIIYSFGERVPMMNGYFATSHIGHTWFDDRDPIDYADELMKYKDISEFRAAYSIMKKEARTVNVKRLYNSLSKDKQEALKGYEYLFEGERLK